MLPFTHLCLTSLNACHYRLLQLHREKVAKRLADAIDEKKIDGLSRAIDDAKRYDVGGSRFTMNGTSRNYDFGGSKFTINGTVLHLEAAESLLNILIEQRRLAEAKLNQAMVIQIPVSRPIKNAINLFVSVSFCRMTPIHLNLLA